ncbi:BnaCnng56870D [Brassica napus]|uniref:BnaAnng12760D protein n=1 Tax=Brassica napus TaxID=3708 RepID=A0A078IXK0_BRANA|nr:BnaAnng12760D [Brassica napus]CDY67902.1 BnaCnng56870D [Brassica napus]
MLFILMIKIWISQVMTRRTYHQKR